MSNQADDSKIGLRSHAVRDDHKGERKRPFDMVPDDSLEQVHRDVTVSAEGLPFWAVETLFHRIHSELGKPDLNGWGATLAIKYSGLDEDQYAKLIELRELLWTDFDVETTETRLYPPRKAYSEQREDPSRNCPRYGAGGFPLSILA